MWPLIIVGIVVVIAVALWLAYPAYKRSQIAAECASLEASLAALTAQGAPFTDIDPIQRQLTACRLRMGQTAGTVAAAAANDCLASRDRIRREWLNLLNTSYSDPVKRDNIRGAIHRIGAEMVDCFARAGALASNNVAALEKILADLGTAFKDSNERIAAYNDGMLGTGRFALNEPTGPEKAAAEQQQISMPLGELYARLAAQLRDAKRERDRARQAGTPASRAAAAARRASSADFWAAAIAARDARRAAERS